MINGLLDEIQGRVERFFKEYQDGLVVFTGGDAEMIHKIGSITRFFAFAEYSTRTPQCLAHPWQLLRGFSVTGTLYLRAKKDPNPSK